MKKESADDNLRPVQFGLSFRRLKVDIDTGDTSGLISAEVGYRTWLAA